MLSGQARSAADVALLRELDLFAPSGYSKHVSDELTALVASLPGFYLERDLLEDLARQRRFDWIRLLFRRSSLVAWQHGVSASLLLLMSGHGGTEMLELLPPGQGLGDVVLDIFETFPLLLSPPILAQAILYFPPRVACMTALQLRVRPIRNLILADGYYHPETLPHFLPQIKCVKSCRGMPIEALPLLGDKLHPDAVTDYLTELSFEPNFDGNAVRLLIDRVSAFGHRDLTGFCGARCETKCRAYDGPRQVLRC